MLMYGLVFYAGFIVGGAMMAMLAAAGRADLEAEIYRLQERERSCGGYSS
jgi:hypothetical protein